MVSLFVPGWGLWIVGKRNLALAVATSSVGLVLGFSWSRLVLNAEAYLVFCGLLIAVIVVAACYAAIVAVRRNPDSVPPMNWKSTFAFAVVFTVVFLPISWNKSIVLGFEVFHLPASSMAPTLLRGDHFVVDTWAYSDIDIAAGDIAVFAWPGSNGANYVKRVVGVPGDVLMFGANTLTRNGILVDEPYAYYTPEARAPQSTIEKFVVPDGAYFVLGDNRNRSNDSRYIGPIPKERFVGRAVHISFSRDEETGIRWERFPAEIL